MKNEILAQAMTHIDDALIAEADERRSRGAKDTEATVPHVEEEVITDTPADTEAEEATSTVDDIIDL